MKLALATIATVCLAGAIVRAQDPNDTEREYRRLLSRDDHLMVAGPARSEAFAHLEHDYRRFLVANPTHVRAMIAFGSFLDDTGHGDEAMQWWEKALALDPNAAAALNNIANHYGHTGRAGDALRYYAKAIAIEPDEPMYRYNWAVTCSLFRKDAETVYRWDTAEVFRRSLAQFRAARDMAPTDFAFAKAYAETFYLMPQPDWTEARVAWKACLGLVPNDERREGVYCNIARVSIHMKDFDEARMWLDKVKSPQLEPQRRALERQLPRLDGVR